MLGTYLGLIFTVILVISLYSLSNRLQLFSNKSAAGRYSFFVGSILLILAAVWLSLRMLPQYADWFIVTAYSVIDIMHLIVAALGLSLTVGGLVRYVDSFNDLQAEVEFRFQKLGILENLQRDAREPYQFLELLNLAIKEIAATIPECSGVVFLTGRNRKQFILATSIGLTTEETGWLEYFPFGDNIVSQSVETGEPVLSGNFEFVDENGLTKDSRFESALVLPLLSGMDRIGAIVLLSTVERIFSHHDVRVLAPIGEWLAEKIKSARATRELSAVRKEKEDQSELFGDSFSRIMAAFKAVNSQDSLNNMAAALKGFSDSESVQIVRSSGGALEQLAGTEPLMDISDEFVEAIAGTISRNKISVVNQNAEDEQGRTFTKYSTLVYPLKDSGNSQALLIRRQSIPFALDNTELKVLSVFSGLVSLTLAKTQNENSEVTRRLGFDKIVQLLRMPPRLSFTDDPGYLARHLAAVLPLDTNILTFVCEEENYRLLDIFGEISTAEIEMTIADSEGFIARAAKQKNAIIISDSKRFEKALDKLEKPNRKAFNRLIENSFVPVCVMAIPIIIAGKAEGVVLFMFKTMLSSERREWERLITLACGLFSLRMSVSAMHQYRPVGSTGDDLAKITNAINNNLSAVIGNAEILMTKEGLNNEIRSHIQSIMNEAEVAAAEVGKLLQEKDRGEIKMEVKPELLSLNEIAQLSLKESLVSENLYMIAGRAREIEFRLSDITEYKFPGIRMQSLFNGAINRFASMADDDDIITVSTYIRDDSLYLDISRHRRNFPPVESVAGFGNYQFPDEALKARPGDKYLESMSATDGRFAYDRFSTAPSYLSFKFPMGKTFEDRKTDASVRILAVDDQPVILELISAMCQTLGYEVTTAVSGAEALELARDSEFKVILTDLAMPGMSGLELGKSLRQRFPDTPIILITGWEATIGEQELRDSGITDILYKPFRIEQLTNLVKTAATGQSA